MGLPRKLIWNLYAGAIGAAAAVVVNKALGAAWRAATGDEPPAVDDPDASTRRLLAWTLASAAGMAVATVAVNRFAASSWERALGEPAPRRGRR